MAVRDVKNAQILSNGWQLQVTYDTMSAGGTHDLNLGTNNDPTNANIELSVTSQGYNTSGALGTIARTIYGTEDVVTDCLRKAYPNQTDPQETVSGSDLIVVYPLSEPIYNDDTSITVDFTAATYNDGTYDSNVASSLAVTNNSALDYTKVIGNWAMAQRYVFTDDFDLEFCAFHGHAKSSSEVACVKFTITDEHTNSVTYTVTAMTISSQDDYNSVIAYIQTVNVSTLTSGDKLTCTAIAYPWVGDADSILDTSDAVFSFPTPKYTDLQVTLYKSNEYGHCVVDATSGSDATGAVYSSQSGAESAHTGDATTAYQTIAASLTGLQSYHNSNFSRNHCGGGWIYCTEDTHTLNSQNGGACTEYVTITKLSTASRDNVYVNPAAVLARLADYTLFKNIRVNTAYYWYCVGGEVFGYEGCEVNFTGSITATTFPYATSIRNTGTFAKYYRPAGTNGIWAIVRGCDHATPHNSKGWVSVGNHNVYVVERATGSGIVDQDGGMYAFNTVNATDNEILVSIVTIDSLSHGYAIVQNELERYADAGGPIATIGQGANDATANNIILQYNTFAGERNNLAYNDSTATTPYYHLRWFQQNNIYSNYNHKDDVFETDGTCTGGWYVGYMAGAISNHFRTTENDDWIGDFIGLWSTRGTTATPIEPGYVDDKSADGDDAGGGDYHLTESSPVREMSKVVQLPYDLDGETRYINGAIGAYEYIESSSIPVFIHHLKTQGVL